MDSERPAQPVPEPPLEAQVDPQEVRRAAKTVPSERPARGAAFGELDLPAPDSEAYDLSAMLDNRQVQKYEPKFLARGGEHVVYEVPFAPGVVVKVDANSMRRTHKFNADHGMPLDGMHPDLLPHMEEKVRLDRERFLKLRKAFGREHVAGMKQGIVQVPVTEKMLASIHRGNPPGSIRGIDKTWAITKVQRKASEIGREGTLSITGGYMEHGPVDPEAYAEVTRAYVDGDNDGHASLEARQRLKPMPIREVLVAARKEAAAAEALKDFVTKTIAYANEQGEILDLAGMDNVTFYKDGDRWNYNLVDALYGAPRLLHVAESAAKSAAEGDEIGQYGRNVLLNAVNFTRTINLLADELGVADRVDWMPKEARGKLNFQDLLK